MTGKAHIANDAENFIVRLDRQYFFLSFGTDGDDVRGTKVLSEAAHMNYREADTLSQSLKAKNYGAFVCDRYGQAVTVRTLQAKDEPNLPMTPDEFRSMNLPTIKRRYYSEPKFRERIETAFEQGVIERPEDLPKEESSDLDWALLGAVGREEEPSHIAERFGITIQDLAVRMSAASRKFDRVISDMQKSTRESSELRDRSREEFEERKQRNKK